MMEKTTQLASDNLVQNIELNGVVQNNTPIELSIPVHLIDVISVKNPESKNKISSKNTNGWFKRKIMWIRRRYNKSMIWYYKLGKLELDPGVRAKFRAQQRKISAILALNTAQADNIHKLIEIASNLTKTSIKLQDELNVTNIGLDDVLNKTSMMR